VKPLTGKPSTIALAWSDQGQADARIVRKTSAADGTSRLWVERYVAALPQSHPLS